MNIERTHRTVWIGLGLGVVVALAAVLALSGGVMGRPPMVGYGARPFMGAVPWFWGIGLIGLVIRVFVWGGLILLGVSLMRRIGGPHIDDGRRGELSSLEILKRRYAAGEISREQFEEMRRVLEPGLASQ